MDSVFLTFDDGPYAATLEVLDALKRQKVTATFFLQLRRNGDREQEWFAIRRMVSEGHSLANHGVDHDPASAAGYKAAKPADVHKDFAENEQILKEMFASHKQSYPGMKVARLPGDGRFQNDYVEMIIGDFKVPHASWDVEFAPPGRLKHIGVRDWQGVKGVNCTTPNMPSPNNVVLLHDLHWKGKGRELEALISKLKEKFKVRSMVPLPPNLRSVRYKV